MERLSSLLLVLIIGGLLTPLGGVSLPTLTIHSPDGDLIDCIRRKDQIAFRHPLLKNHLIQEAPTDMPYTVNKEENGWQVWHKNGTKCPEGSIPVRRLHQNQTVQTISSNAADRVTNGHEYAIGRPNNSQPIYGTQVTMNVWQPKIERFDEFSLGQIWLVSGSYGDSSINSIEAGWQVYPKIYFDYQPRLFIYWTADAYNITGCYNLRCGGFIQTSRTIVVEGAISPTSVVGGTQVDLTFKIWKDQKLGSWWLAVGLGHGVLEPVGYWPDILFSLQKDYAHEVEWGGEITNRRTFGRHTTTEMGSGYFPDSGFGKAAYMRNIEVLLSGEGFQSLQNLAVGGTNPAYYQANTSNNPEFGTHFFYGGPKYATAAHLTWDSTLLYLCFCLLFLVV